MKKSILLGLLFLGQLSNATWMTSFDDAKKLAMATNKFMIVDFWATWCGPCKKMDQDSWSDAEVNQIMENYIQVKVDIDADKELALQYGIQSIPNMFILDGNGKVVYTFSGYHDAAKLRRELEKFAFSTEFISHDLVNYFRMKNYNTSTRVYLKGLDYSLLVNSEIKDKIIDWAKYYLEDAKKELNKKDEGYAVKKQKLELLALFPMAYQKKFEKISKKLSDFKPNEIDEANLGFYNFLRYIAAKGLNDPGVAALENDLKGIDGFDYYIDKVNLILSKA
ncbi:thioredoxin family protein [Flavobacterium sp.]